MTIAAQMETPLTRLTDAIDALVLSQEEQTKRLNLGSHLAHMGQLWREASDAVMHFVAHVAPTIEEPGSMEAMHEAYRDVNERILAIKAVGRDEEYAHNRDTLVDARLHLKVLHDAADVFGWAISPQPIRYLSEVLEGMEYNGQRLLVAARASGDATPHEVFFQSLQDYVQSWQDCAAEKYAFGSQWLISASHVGSAQASVGQMESGAIESPRMPSQPSAALGDRNSSGGRSSFCRHAHRKLSGNTTPVLMEVKAGSSLSISRSPMAISCSSRAHLLLLTKVGDGFRSLATLCQTMPYPPAFAQAAHLAVAVFEHYERAMVELLNGNVKHAQRDLLPPLLLAIQEAGCFIWNAITNPVNACCREALRCIAPLIDLLSWVQQAPKDPVEFMRSNLDTLMYVTRKSIIQHTARASFTTLVCRTGEQLVSHVTENFPRGTVATVDRAGEQLEMDVNTSQLKKTADIAAAIDGALHRICILLVQVAETFASTLTVVRYTRCPSEHAAERGIIFSPLNDAINRLAEACRSVGQQRARLAQHARAVSLAADVYTWLASDSPVTLVEESVANVCSCLDFITAVSASATHADAHGQPMSPSDITNVKWATSLREALQEHSRSVSRWHSTVSPWGVRLPASSVPTPAASAASAPEMGGRPASGCGEVMGSSRSNGHSVAEVPFPPPSVPDAVVKSRRGCGPKETPSCRLEADKKWVVEHHWADENDPWDVVRLPESQMEKRHIVSVLQCRRTHIVIPCKVNTVQIVDCAEVLLELGDTVGPVEVAGSERVELRIQGAVPSIIASKSTGLLVHLGHSLETDIVTSCTSLVQVKWATEENDEVQCLTIPERFVSTIGTRDRLHTKVGPSLYDSGYSHLKFARGCEMR